MASKTDKRVVPTPKKLECTPIQHRTTTGLKFWYDHSARRVVTEDPDISVNFVRTGGIDAVMFVYLKMPGLSIQVGQKGNQPFPVSVYRGPKYDTVWEIGSFGVPLYYHEQSNSYTTQVKPGSLEQKPVAVDSKFASEKQQATAVSIIIDILEKYNGEWIGACRGEDQTATVVIDPELNKKLMTGELIG